MPTTFNGISHGPFFLPIFGSVRVKIGGKEERLQEGDIRSWNKHGMICIQRVSERSGLIMHTDLYGNSRNITLDAGWTFISNGKWYFSGGDYESHVAGELISRTGELEPKLKEWVCNQIEWNMQVEGITLASVPLIQSCDGWSVARVDKATNNIYEIKENLQTQQAYEIARGQMSTDPREIAVVYRQGTPKAVFYRRARCAGD